MMTWRQAHPRLWVAFKIVLFVIGFLLVLLLGLIAYINTDSFKERASTWASDKSGRKIAIEGGIHGRWGGAWTPHIVLEKIVIGNADWSKQPTMFKADSLEVSIHLPDLLRGRVSLPELILQKPELVLEKNKDGDSNWDFTENPEAAAATAPLPDERAEVPLIGRLRIDDGKLTYRDATQKINAALDVSTAKGAAKAGEEIRFKGTGDYRGGPFSLTFTGGSVLSLRDNDKPYPFFLDTTIGGTHARVEGKADDPVTLEGLDVTLRLKGKNAADLFPITGIALPPTPAYDIRGQLIKDDESWIFNNFKGKLGNSDLAGSVRWYSERKQPLLKATFVSENLDLADLGGFIGAKEEKQDDGRVIPDTPLDISRLMAMDADVTLKGKHIKTPDVLDDFAMTLKLRDGTLEVKPVEFGMAGGHIRADLAIEGKKEPPFTTMDVDFQRLSLHRLFQPLVEKYGEDNVSAGLLGGKANFKGEGKSLREMLGSANGEMGVGMEGGKLSRLLLELAGLDIFKSLGLVVTGSDEPVEIRCVVGDFNVTNGLMKSQAAFIDTKVTTLEGKGTINLKNEAMAMQITVHPKDPSPLSARAPINIDGTLAKPEIGVDTAALATRAGAAVALGVVLTPIGSLLAFVEPGLGKDSQCAAFLHELNQKTEGAIPNNKK
ncbi:MAG: AsmA family protein [Rickettsiales bacterium]